MAITLTEARRAARHALPREARQGRRRAPGRAAPPAARAWPTSSSTPTRSRPRTCVFESHGVKVLVDPKSLPYIDGTELDFAREGLNEGFKFNNPNEQGPLRLRRDRSTSEPASRPRARRLRGSLSSPCDFARTTSSCSACRALRAGPRRARRALARAAGARCIPTASPRRRRRSAARRDAVGGARQRGLPAR